MSEENDIQKWLDAVRDRPFPKIVTGLRGTGKSAFLEGLYNRLRAQGVSRRRVVYLDSSNAVFRRCATGEDVLRLLLPLMPADGPFHMLVREAAGFPDPEVVMAALARRRPADIIATSSSRRLLHGPLSTIHRVYVESFETLPPAGVHTYSPERERARWNEIFLRDVIAHARVAEYALLVRVAGWLSDNLGEMISLRRIADAISPVHRRISPHTVGTYLESLEDANLVARATRWDTQEDAPLSTGYRYYFTDPNLRFAQFGPAPEDERRRMALNRAWLWLRHGAETVYSASGRKNVDFVTENGNAHAYWKVDVGGDCAVTRVG